MKKLFSQRFFSNLTYGIVSIIMGTITLTQAITRGAAFPWVNQWGPLANCIFSGVFFSVGISLCVFSVVTGILHRD